MPNAQCPILRQLLETLFAFAQYKCPMPNTSAPFGLPRLLRLRPSASSTSPLGFARAELSTSRYFGYALLYRGCANDYQEGKLSTSRYKSLKASRSVQVPNAQCPSSQFGKPSTRIKSNSRSNISSIGNI
ncbi:hypothetical protein [Nostoc sp.]|uniref:hypothetical protein n=1 Tax=Nostoc sp. TaxID=1180 RepID=UPI002FF46986